MAFFPSEPDADMKRTLARIPAIGIPFSQLNEAVMRGDAPFTAGERELLAAYVSALHGCDYCQCEHAALAAAFGLPEGLLAQLLHDVDTAEVSEAFRAAVVYARKLTLCPTRLGPADVAALFAAGHDERALYFLVFVTAVFTMSNRIVQGLGLTTPSPAGLHEAVERLHRQGYAGTVQYIRAQAEHVNAHGGCTCGCAVRVTPDAGADMEGAKEGM
jgi:uncharacterized peroxidase-related enzyme